MKQIFFNAIVKFNLPYDELEEERKEYLEEELNEVEYGRG